MTRLSLMINDLNARLKNDLLIYPCQATLKLDHLRTYSLLHLDMSALTGQLDFDKLAYLIKVIDQIQSIVEITTAIFRPTKVLETMEDDQISVDDLRNGTMKCLFQASHSQPNVNEIVFITSSNRLTSSMTWKYTERRSMLKCHILPLPFDDELHGIVLSHRVKTVGWVRLLTCVNEFVADRMFDAILAFWHKTIRHMANIRFDRWPTAVSGLQQRFGTESVLRDVANRVGQCLVDHQSSSIACCFDSNRFVTKPTL
jgi:hypothetical protein